jgi:hypothetical protein
MPRQSRWTTHLQTFFSDMFSYFSFSSIPYTPLSQPMNRLKSKKKIIGFTLFSLILVTAIIFNVTRPLHRVNTGYSDATPVLVTENKMSFLPWKLFYFKKSPVS